MKLIDLKPGQRFRDRSGRLLERIEGERRMVVRTVHVRVIEPGQYDYAGSPSEYWLMAGRDVEVVE